MGRGSNGDVDDDEDDGGSDNANSEKRLPQKGQNVKKNWFQKQASFYSGFKLKTY